MLNKLKSQREGFTIIEVIIVLVIGAVILLAVFLVVPQLQNAQRNSRQRAIAQQYLSAYEELRAQAGGNLPVNTNEIQVRAGGPLKNGTTDVVLGGAPGPNQVQILAGQKCNSAGTGTSVSANDSAALVGAYPSGTICVGPK